MLSVEGFLSGGAGWEVLEPWDSLLENKFNVIISFSIETHWWIFNKNVSRQHFLCFSYLSAVSFFAGGELLFFESVDSRLKWHQWRETVNTVSLAMSFTSMSEILRSHDLESQISCPVCL